jgi:hypothetical protein
MGEDVCFSVFHHDMVQDAILMGYSAAERLTALDVAISFNNSGDVWTKELERRFKTALHMHFSLSFLLLMAFICVIATHMLPLDCVNTKKVMMKWRSNQKPVRMGAWHSNQKPSGVTIAPKPG